ncbi:hypothetical protein LAZ67_15002825 [Cordylochernes scorpioides]|uniref:Uncharacterized protein n=1 Tax=Cordylochernes scorpioides TaxID=51811 RepID=A0ABY6LB19_9ARAC|nr:hypothetical protein LAZ67_15002825 [Cordylochernes scorpioides]
MVTWGPVVRAPCLLVVGASMMAWVGLVVCGGRDIILVEGTGLLLEVWGDCGGGEGLRVGGTGRTIDGNGEGLRVGGKGWAIDWGGEGLRVEGTGRAIDGGWDGLWVGGTSRAIDGAPLKDCTTLEQRKVIRFLNAEGIQTSQIC